MAALNRLVVDRLSQPAKRRRHAAIAITAFVAVEDRSDLVLERGMPIRPGRRFLLIVERAARQARKLEQSVKRVERP
jgi:hypothetical protein